jgi:hypothetical protein
MFGNKLFKLGTDRFLTMVVLATLVIGGSSSANANDWQDWKYIFPPDGTISKYYISSNDRQDGTQTEEVLYHYLPNNVIVEYKTLYENSAPSNFGNSKIKFLLENNKVFQLKPNGEKTAPIFEKIEMGKLYTSLPIVKIEKSITLNGNGSKNFKNCFIAESEGYKDIFCKDVGLVYDESPGNILPSEHIYSSAKANNDELNAFKTRFMNKWEW